MNCTASGWSRDLKEGTSHIYKKRTFYVDEDSWQILAMDQYDSRGNFGGFPKHIASTTTKCRPSGARGDPL